VATTSERYSSALRIAEFIPFCTSSGTASTFSSGLIPLNSIGSPLIPQRLRLGSDKVPIPLGKLHVRFALDEPAVGEPKSFALP